MLAIQALNIAMSVSLSVGVLTPKTEGILSSGFFGERLGRRASQESSLELGFRV